MVILRHTAFTDCSRRLRVERAGELFIPVQLAPSLRHAVVYFPCAGNSLCNIGGVSGNLRGDDSLSDVVHIRQGQMLRRRHIAEERRAMHSGRGAADSRSYVVVSRSNIRHQRPQHIKGGAHAKRLLQFHVRCDLVQRHMAGAFHHDLHVMRPGPFRQFPEANQLVNLAGVRSVRQTTGAAGVAERNGHIVFLANIEDFVKMLVKGILIARHAYPRKNETAASADDIHLSPMRLDFSDCFPRNSAVDRHKIHPVLRVKPNHIQKILRRKLRQILLAVNHAVIHGHRTNHSRAFPHQLLPKRARAPVTRKVHDRFGTEFHRAHDLLHFHVVICAIPRDA